MLWVCRELSGGNVMAFGDAELKLGSDGAEVIELQVRLAGFLGTVWDGAFGPGTERQVKIFQQDYMEMQNPTGRVEIDTFNAYRAFLSRIPDRLPAVEVSLRSVWRFREWSVQRGVQGWSPSDRVLSQV